MLNTPAAQAAGPPKRKRGRPPKVREAPAFISGADIAYHMRITAPQLYRWVAEGQFPPPHSRPGQNTRLWLRTHWDEYVATGKFPARAWARG